jgi:hypothetical protein
VHAILGSRFVPPLAAAQLSTMALGALGLMIAGAGAMHMIALYACQYAGIPGGSCFDRPVRGIEGTIRPRWGEQEAAAGSVRSGGRRKRQSALGTQHPPSPPRPSPFSARSGQ